MLFKKPDQAAGLVGNQFKKCRSGRQAIFILMSSKTIIFGEIGYTKMRNDDNDCKCILSSYKNLLSDKTSTYYFLFIPASESEPIILSIFIYFLKTIMSQ